MQRPARDGPACARVLTSGHKGEQAAAAAVDKQEGFSDRETGLIIDAFLRALQPPPQPQKLQPQVLPPQPGPLGLLVLQAFELLFGFLVWTFSCFAAAANGAAFVAGPAAGDVAMGGAPGQMCTRILRSALPGDCRTHPAAFRQVLWADLAANDGDDDGAEVLVLPKMEGQQCIAQPVFKKKKTKQQKKVQELLEVDSVSKLQAGMLETEANGSEEMPQELPEDFVAKAAALWEGDIFAEEGWHPSILGATAKCSCSKAGNEALSATGTCSSCSGVMAEAESIASSICKSTVKEVDQSTILEKVPLFVDRLLAASREGRPCTFSDVGAEWFIELEDLGFDLDPERVWDFYKAVLAEAVRAEKLAEGGENSRVRPRRRGRP